MTFLTDQHYAHHTFFDASQDRRIHELVNSILRNATDQVHVIDGETSRGYAMDVDSEYAGAPAQKVPAEMAEMDMGSALIPCIHPRAHMAYNDWKCIYVTV